MVAITDDEIRHLLRRTEFVVRGARFNRIKAIADLDRAKAVADVLNVPDADVHPSTPSSLNVHSDDGSYDQWVTLVQWWCDRMARTAVRPIQEKMTLFWHGHFTSGWGKVNNTPAMATQNRVYRYFATGDFRTLAQRMAVEPAMLLWLDNAENNDISPNQNFARELMELFLLGVNQYTENDVVGASRAWAGYSIDWNRYHDQHQAVYQYHAADHAPASATWPLFGITKHWTGPMMIDFILGDPTRRTICAQFICKKLWEFFAYQNPDPAIVQALAQVFISSSWNIRAVLSALFQRDEFYSAASLEGSVRSPVDYVVATLAHTNSTSAQLHPEWTLERMGQKLLEPPNVSGWRLNDYWLNSSAWTGRAEFASYARWVLTDRAAYQAVKSMSPAAATDWMAANFGVHPLSTVSRTAIINWINSEADEPWTVESGIVVMTMLTPEFHRG